MRRRKFIKGALNHCYQRMEDRGVLFYTYADHLVFFTQYCVIARKYGIRVLSLCQMPDHIHDSVIANRKKDLDKFKQDSLSWFALRRNARVGMKGAVFECSFGSAPKIGDKNVRSNLVYVGNNPVERKLVSEAEKYRWNYLAYAQSDHPFSEKLVLRTASGLLRKAVKEVKVQAHAAKPMNYAMIRRLFAPLDYTERQQLVDFIVKSYNVIDYAEASRYFGSFDAMLIAMHATTGNEHDLNEVFIGKSDAHYNRMTSILLREGIVKEIHEILSLPVDKKYDLFLLLRRETMATSEQIAAFLHMPLKQTGDRRSGKKK